MARDLAKANVSKAIKAALGQTPDPNALKPGHMRLYSFYAPSLTPGPYGIEAVQVIKSDIKGPNPKSEELDVFNYESPAAGSTVGTLKPSAPPILQQFNVIAPQFYIDPRVVNSFYPPPGHLDEGRVLPHIVFNDPHLPWDRDLLLDVRELFPPPGPIQPPPVPEVPRIKLVGKSPVVSESLLSSSNASTSAAAAVIPEMLAAPPPVRLPPWMALIVFDPSELKLTSTDETALGIPIPDPAKVPNTTPQPQQPVPNAGQIATPNSYPMQVGDYLTKITSRVEYEAGFPTFADLPEFQALQKSTDPTTIIFPQKSLVATVLDPVYQFMLMSHVRQINTTGFPDAGVQEEGLYSVCISKRSGITSYPTSNPGPLPMTQVVHLISLEYIQQTDLRATGASDRIGLVSLYSWTYLVRSMRYFLSPAYKLLPLVTKAFVP